MMMMTSSSGCFFTLADERFCSFSHSSQLLIPSSTDFSFLTMTKTTRLTMEHRRIFSLFILSLMHSAIFISAFPVKHFRPKSSVLCPNQKVILALARRTNNNDFDDERRTTDGPKMPQLPAIGGSSLGLQAFSSGIPTGGEGKDTATKSEAAFVGRKFELLYTCNVCETRNSHRVSRIAYNNGVVIARCKGCDSQHLIADNLGFTNLFDKESDGGNIEEYFKNNPNRGQEVNRVTQEVFELERVLNHDAKSGSIIGHDGKPALE